MRVNIRPDHCIALRLITAQEHYRKSQDWLNMVPEWERLVEVAGQSQAIIKMQADEILRLRAEIASANEQLVRADLKLNAVRAENEKLRAALKPFADCEVWEGYKGYERFVAGMFHIHNKGMDSLNISHIRAARAALGEKNDN